MLQAVNTFESVLACNILMWDMTFIAGGNILVGRMVPCGIIWLHYVTVHTGRRVVTQIGMETQHVHEQRTGTDESSRHGQ